MEANAKHHSLSNQMHEMTEYFLNEVILKAHWQSSSNRKVGGGGAGEVCCLSVFYLVELSDLVSRRI